MTNALFDRLQCMPVFSNVIVERIEAHRSSEAAKSELNCDSLPFFDKMCLLCKKAIEAVGNTLSPKTRFVSTTDYTNRLVLAQLNSIPSSSEFPYEGCFSQVMEYYWNSILATLPSSLTAQVGQEELILLKNGCTRVDWDKDINYPKLAKSIQTGELNVLPAGYKTHSIYTIFYKGYMLTCNRGDRPANTPSILAFKIDLQYVTAEKIKKIIDNLKNPNREECLTYLYTLLPDALKKSMDSICIQLQSLSGKDQTVSNCTSTSYKEALKAAYALLGIRLHLDGTAYIPEEHLKKANAVKKLLSAHARASMLNYYCTPGLETYNRANSSGVSTRHDTPRDLYLIEQCRKKTWLHLQQANIDPINYPHLPKLTPIEEQQIPMELAAKQNKKEQKSASQLSFSQLSCFNFDESLLRAMISEDGLRVALPSSENPTSASAASGSALFMNPAHPKEEIIG